jgi:hypothetical protein
MEALAAWFIVSMARIIALSIKRTSAKKIPGILSVLGEQYTPKSETLKLERVVKSDILIKTIMAQSGNFENDSFPRFMKICLEMICSVTRSEENPDYIIYSDMFNKYIREAVTAVEVLNVKENAALEAMFYNLKKCVKAGYNG